MAAACRRVYFSFNMDLLEVPSTKNQAKEKEREEDGSQVESTSHTVCEEQDLGMSTFNRKCAFFTVVMKVSDE